MKDEFKAAIERIKAEAKEPTPRVRFPHDFRNSLSQCKDLLDDFEGITIILENHPFRPFGSTSGYTILNSPWRFPWVRVAAYAILRQARFPEEHGCA